MDIKLAHCTDIASRHAKLFDLHADYGLAYLVEEDDRQDLFVNDELWCAWRKQFDVRSMLLKWLDRNRVILYLGNRTTSIISSESQVEFNFGPAEKIYVSQSHIFVGFGDEDIFGPSSVDAPEYFGLCVFSHDGIFEFGLRTYLEVYRCDDWPAQIYAAYTYEDRLIFQAMVEDRLHILDVAKPHMHNALISYHLSPRSVMCGNDRRAFAISDFRLSSGSYPKDPPVELATIDLVTETVTKRDFAPFEAELINAGFDMKKFAFQPNSTGRIIVTDGAQAALLEISTTE
ncbi:MAG: hypothetical protein ACLPID_13865 [Beijerinckiaceae bacterium]